jgi:type I restriction enzyme, S subunit
MAAIFARLNGAILGSRIDATYYRPEYISNELRLRRSGLEVARLGSLVAEGRRAVYFGTSTLERDKAPDNWLPFLTADDLGSDGFFLDLDARRRVSPDFASRYPNGLLRANELLVKVKGPNQTTAYNPVAPSRPTLVSGTIWGALVRRDNIDPDYLVTALSSAYAALARTRLRTNLNVEFLSPADLCELELPVPSSRAAQKYVGGKVRQAQRLRDFAANCQAGFLRAIDREYPLIDRKYEGSLAHSRASTSFLNGSLNPGAFNPDRLLVRQYFAEHGGKKVCDVADVETPVSTAYRPSDAYVGLDSIASENGAISPTTIGEEGVIGAVRVLREGPVISKLRPYLNKVAYIPAAMSGAFASTELLCVQPSDRAVGWFLYGTLRLASTVRQLNPLSTGSTHPRVSREDISEVIVPWITDPASAGRLLELGQNATIAAARLAAGAKFLVEALIDGRLSESELVEAQNGLDADNTGADRRILTRLTPVGVDVEGRNSLFPDFDAHYAIIAEAERARGSAGDTP